MLDSAGQPGSAIGRVVMGVDDVDQCIAIILTTPKGTDVLRPTFGTDLWKYIDAPINRGGTGRGPRSHSIDYSVGAAS